MHVVHGLEFSMFFGAMSRGGSVLAIFSELFRRRLIQGSNIHILSILFVSVPHNITKWGLKVHPVGIEPLPGSCSTGFAHTHPVQAFALCRLDKPISYMVRTLLEGHPRGVPVGLRPTGSCVPPPSERCRMGTGEVNINCGWPSSS